APLLSQALPESRRLLRQLATAGRRRRGGSRSGGGRRSRYHGLALLTSLVPGSALRAAGRRIDEGGHAVDLAAIDVGGKRSGIARDAQGDDEGGTRGGSEGAASRRAHGAVGLTARRR